MMANSKLEVITYNKSVLLDYNAEETVLQLKQKLYMNEHVGVPASKQRLYYFGYLLQDFKTLASYNINPEKYTVVLLYDLNCQRKKKHHRKHGSILLDMLFDQCQSNSQLNRSEESCSQTSTEWQEYSTFAGYCEDRLFLNLVLAMSEPNGSVDDVELAVEELVAKKHSVLDLIYENLGEFLQLCK